MLQRFSYISFLFKPPWWKGGRKGCGLKNSKKWNDNICTLHLKNFEPCNGNIFFRFFFGNSLVYHEITLDNFRDLFCQLKLTQLEKTSYVFNFISLDNKNLQSTFFNFKIIRYNFSSRNAENFLHDLGRKRTF